MGDHPSRDNEAHLHLLHGRRRDEDLGLSGGKDRVILDLILPVTWLGIGVAIGVPLGYWIAVTVWRYSHGWVSRWMDLREDPE